MVDQVEGFSMEEWVSKHNLSGKALDEFKSRFTQDGFDSKAADAWFIEFNKENIQNHSIETDYDEDAPVIIYNPPFTKEELYAAIDEYEPHYAPKILDKFDKYPDMVMFLMEQKDENGNNLLNLDDVCDILDYCGGTIEEDPGILADVFNDENIKNIATAEIGMRGDFIVKNFDVVKETVSEINPENLLPYGILQKTISRLNTFCDQYDSIDPALRKRIIDTFVSNPDYNESDLYKLINDNVKEGFWHSMFGSSKKEEMLDNLENISYYFKAYYDKNKEIYNEAFAKIDTEDESKSIEDKVNELFAIDLEYRVIDIYERNYSYPHEGNSFSFERQNEYDERRDEHENDRRDEHEDNEQELSHAQRCLNAHQEFLAKRQMLIEKYPEVLNLDEVLDDIYRQALTEGKAPKITNNIKTYVGVNLSEDFIKDFNQMKYFVNRKGAEFVGDNVMRKVAKLDEPKTTKMLENIDLEAINNLSPLVKDDGERKAIDGFININLAKESVLQKHPDVAEKLDDIVREVFVDGKQIQECSAMAELSDEVKADMVGFIEKIELNAALKNPDMVKLVDLSKDDIENLLDIKRERGGELVIDEFILNRRNRDEEERDDHDGEERDEHDEEERDEHDGEERDEHDEEERDEHDGEERDDHDEEERDDHDGEERDDHDGEERDEHDGEERDEHDGEERDEHDGEERDEHDGEERDDHDGEERDEHDEEERGDHDGEEHDDHDGEERASGEHADTEQHVGESTRTTTDQEHSRFHFTAEEFKKIEALNLGDEWKKKLDICYHKESNSYSMRVPENDEDRREFMDIISNSMNKGNEEGSGLNGVSNPQLSTPSPAVSILLKHRTNFYDK